MIYLDHNATTPPRAEVVAAVERMLRASWGNPSSIHGAGRLARDEVERARAAVAALIGASREEIIFTSGGTEGNNLAIRGLALAERARRAKGPARVLSSTLEHPSVIGALDELAREGFAIDKVPVSTSGTIDPDAVRAALTPETVLVTLSAANHEIGNLYAMAEFARAAHDVGALFHADCVQAVGRVPVDVHAWNVDAVTVSAHKIYGPKGAGAVFVRRGLLPHPLVAGGHQERERRAGTENSPGIVGFGVACGLAEGALAAADRVAGLRDRLQERLMAIPGARIHGDAAHRVPGTLNMAFSGARGDLVVIGLDLEGVCVSTGAACTSGSLAPSPTILALGIPELQAREAVRFSLGRDTTEDEVDRAAALSEMVVARVRAAAVTQAAV